MTAVEWLERAGKEAVALDPAAGVALLEKALDIAPADWTSWTHLEVALLEPLCACGRLEDARTLVQTVLGRGISPADEFALRCGLVSILGMAGDMASAASECEAAISVPGAPASEAPAWRCIGAGIALLTGRPAEEVHAEAVRALKDAAAGCDTRLTRIARQALALSAGAQGGYDDALENARRARQILDMESFEHVNWLLPHVWEALFLVYLDRFEEANDAFTMARVRAESSGELSRLPLIYAGTAGTHYYAGQWEEARLELDAGLTLAAETGHEALTMLSHALMARMALACDDRRGAQASLDAGTEILFSGRHLFGAELLLLAQGTMSELDSDTKGSLALLEMAWDQTSNIRGLVQSRDIGPALTRLSRAEGQLDRACEVAAEMELLAQRSSALSVSAAAVRCRGLAHDDADILLDAVATYRRTPRLVDVAAVSEEAASCLLARGRSDEAIQLLEAASSIHAKTGAESDLRRVDTLLRGQGVRRRRHGPARADGGWESLSPNELKVVELVAEGLSNPQIGVRLFISRRTVETHLAHVFRKLGLSSRAQVAAAATAREK